jgi:hypothetical protein
MHKKEGNYCRVTHINDPVPLLPLKEWEYRMHAGEIYISKPDLLASVQDLEHCDGDEDPACIASGDSTAATNATTQWWSENGGLWPVLKRFRMWELFFAHRDYFWQFVVDAEDIAREVWYPWKRVVINFRCMHYLLIPISSYQQGVNPFAYSPGSVNSRTSRWQ